MEELQDLLSAYRREYAVHRQAGFSTASRVRAANRAARKMRSIAFKLSELGIQARNEFAKLLEAPDSALQSWVAHHLLEIVGAGEYESRALAVIESRAASDDVDAPGERLWLRQWRKSNRGM